MGKEGLDDAFAAGKTPEDLAAGATKEPPGEERKSQASLLVALARADEAELFHDHEGESYISLTRASHRETHRLRGKATRDWLAARYYAQYQAAPNSQASQDALNALAGIARFEGECRPVHVRLAGDEETIYLDLGNDEWEVARVTQKGWGVIAGADAPVRFRRSAGMLPLPRPIRGGTLSGLRTLLNLRNDAAFDLVAAWLLGALRPAGPYPMLGLAGEQGTAKSTGARMLRSLIDPNVSPLRTEPREEGDLLIAASNGAIVALDNLSHLSPWLSDALCRLSTGGGLSKRTLYTDAEETLIDAQRPILLTGIETVLTRGDAVDRALLVELEKISDESRRTEAELNAAFEACRPGVLGALLDAASTALRNWETTKPERLPRMADFARWVEAGAPAFGWEPNHFLSIYTSNRDEADEIALDALPVGAAVRAFMKGKNMWEGTPSELLVLLNGEAGDTVKDRSWPKKAHNLSGNLKRLAPNLRRLGLEVETGRRATGGRRLITLTCTYPKEPVNQRPECHQRHSPRNDAKTDETHERHSASLQRHSASLGLFENPHVHAGNGQPLRDSDASDAVSAPPRQVRIPVPNGAAHSDDPWAQAERYRL
jgi:hypothetical protein